MPHLRARRPGRVLGLALAAAALALPAIALADSGPSVQGVGENNPVTGPINRFHVEAKFTGNGKLNGFAEFRSVDKSLDHRFKGPVICLRVANNPFVTGGPVATIVFRIDKLDEPPGFPFDADVAWIQDNGKANSKDSPDRIANSLFNSADNPELLNCPDPASAESAARIAGGLTLTKGHLTIKP
jgi:hypothetical protein